MARDVASLGTVLRRLVIAVSAWALSWVIFGALVRVTADLFCIGFRC